MIHRTLLLCAAAAAAGVVALSAAARTAAIEPAAGAIRGVVQIRRVEAATEVRPSPASLGAPAHRPLEFRPAVIYLDQAPRGAFELPEAGRVRMNQEGQAFVPHVLAVTVGTTVDFPNNDVTFHNVFSLSKAKSFDLGRYSRGRSKAVQFDRPGVVQVFCDIHSHMSAYILVFAHRFFAVTDTSGRFAIDGVPPGTYTLAVWHEGEVRQTRAVTVPESGGAIEADFDIR
jgi:plastocyanin